MGITTKVILKIDLIEELELYDWLKSLMQNPIYEDESEKECKFREKMFNALDVVSPKKVCSFRDKPNYNIDDDIPF